VPIGIINSSWGGAAAEAFVDIETLKTEFPQVFTREKGKYEHGIMHNPSLIYNGMVAPFEGFNMRGAIWNQGETNRNRFKEYKTLLPAMFNHWRKKWNDDFSFYMVQVAPFYYNDGRYVTFIGESIVDITKNEKNTGFAATIDIGKCSDIHAPDKETIGKRLALVAFAKDYGFEGIVYSGPIYKSMEIEYSKEEELLGTGGALKKALNLCSGNQVLALNGDTLNILDFKRMFSLHKKWGGMMTIAVCRMEHFDRYGTVEISDGIVSSFKEKGKVEKGYINRGVYIINRNFLKGVKEDKFSFERDVLEKYKGDIHTYLSKGYFIDIGIPEDYRKACLYLNSEGSDV